MNSAEVANQIADLEKELTQILEDNFKVSQEKLTIERQILDLELKKKDLAMSLSKSNHLLKKKRLEISLKQKQFWSVKESGL